MNSLTDKMPGSCMYLSVMVLRGFSTLCLAICALPETQKQVHEYLCTLWLRCCGWGQHL